MNKQTINPVQKVFNRLSIEFNLQLDTYYHKYI